MHARLQPLDGLRGVSILLVLIAHAGYGDIIPGGFGVTIFFFISGYIITRLLLAEVESTGDISFKGFYIRRAFRILPALMVYLAASTFYVWHVTGQVDLPHLAAALFNYYNYYFIYFLPHGGVFASDHPYFIVWSLAVEEHYYIIFPLLLWCFRDRLRLFCGLLVALIILALCWRLYLLESGVLDDLGINRSYKSTDTRFDSIVFGALYAVAARIDGDRLAARLAGAKYVVAAVLLLLISFVVRGWEFRETLRYSLQGIAIFMLFPLALKRDGIVYDALRIRSLVYIGRISYSLYLWHWLVVVVAHRSLPQTVGSLQFAAVVIICSIVMAALSFRLVEQPALALRIKKFG